ncbi:MAG: DEAD/DEAH box helicase [Rhodoferax sp.]|nr:DEAD/DEAH box helicase [Rhodoferax sp.]
MTTPYSSLALADPLKRAVADMGYENMTPIQAQAIPVVLAGQDVMGAAQTGTGKTAAFSLPILDALHRNPRGLRPKTARVLVLTPTRELATQVGKSLETYGAHLRTRHALIYGGVGQQPQVNAMRKGVDVLVACPGRLLDLIQQGHVDLSGVGFFVLDEVDRMLDMGFLRDVQRIVSLLPGRRQSLFFSATLAPPIVKLAHEILRDPASVTIEPEVTTAEKVEQHVCFVAKENKRDLLLDRLARQQPGELSIVFSRTKHGANKLAKQIAQAGFEAEAIHGNRSQAQRDRTLDKFRAGRLPVLVATDVAARGVDVKAVTLVVNYDLPNEPEAYVHRIGRTGRAGATGRAVSFCSPDEREYLRDIEKLIRQEIPVDQDQRWHLSGIDRLPTRPPERKARTETKHDTAGSRPRRRRRRRPTRA